MSLDKARIVFEKASQAPGLAGGNFDKDGLLSISLKSRSRPRINIVCPAPDDSMLIYAPTARVPETREGEIYRLLMQRELLFPPDPGTADPGNGFPVPQLRNLCRLPGGWERLRPAGGIFSGKFSGGSGIGVL